MSTLPSQIVQDIRSSVEQECSAMEEVITILLREQEQLVSGSSEGLDSVVREKETSLDQLELMRKGRLNTMASAGAPSDPALIDQFINVDAKLARLWQRLRALARECQRVNALNGRLVSVRLQFVDGRLDTLRGLNASQAMYDPIGRPKYAKAGRIIATV